MQQIALCFCCTERGDKVSPRTGRPKAEKPKVIQVKARIDHDTDEKLKEYCIKVGDIRIYTGLLHESAHNEFAKPNLAPLRTRIRASANHRNRV